MPVMHLALEISLPRMLSAWHTMDVGSLRREFLKNLLCPWLEHRALPSGGEALGLHSGARLSRVRGRRSSSCLRENWVHMA